jgi:hypothetical protein
MCFFLAIGIFIEERNWSSKNALGAVNTFGMTPLFFYLTHLWLYRLRLPMVPPPFHLDLIQTLAFWVVGLVVLWMLCSQYIKIKRRYPRVLQYI